MKQGWQLTLVRGTRMDLLPILPASASPSDIQSKFPVASQEPFTIHLLCVQVSAGPSEADIQAEVAAVVRSVLGADVAPDAPLMAAGLDSLGKPRFMHAQCLRKWS